MARDKPPFAMKAILRLGRGTASAAATLRRYAALADELGAEGMDVDVERADLLLSSALVAANEEGAMHAMASPLLHRFGWREQDFEYMRNVRYAETTAPPSRPPAVELRIERGDQEFGWEGTTHDLGLTPDRTLEIRPVEGDVVARIFVAVPATTIAGTVDGLEPWFSRVEPAAVGVNPGRAALLYRAHADVRTETTKLGLSPVEAGRIEADADHIIETATAADGTALWLRRGADPVSRLWPGVIEIREMVIDESHPN